MLVHININSFWCKFDRLVYAFKGIVDIILITETALDDSSPIRLCFPNISFMQFNTEIYYTFRLDPNEYGGGILLYLQDDIPSKLIPMKNH